MYTEYRPLPEEQDFASEFFHISGRHSNEPGTQLIVPDGTCGLLIMLNASLDRSSSITDSTSAKLNGAYVFGQKSRSIFYNLTDSRVEAIGVKLRPAILSRLFDVSDTTCVDQYLELADVLPATERSWIDKIHSASSATQRLQTLRAFMLAQFDREKSVQEALIDHILRFIHEKKGDIRIADIADSFAVTYKTLERLFRKHLGMTPKMYCRIIRFNATIHYRSRFPNLPLTYIGYAAGYYDQMHFINEVKKFTGQTPTAFYQRPAMQIESGQRTFCAKQWQ